MIFSLKLMLLWEPVDFSFPFSSFPMISGSCKAQLAKHHVFWTQSESDSEESTMHQGTTKPRCSQDNQYSISREVGKLSLPLFLPVTVSQGMNWIGFIAQFKLYIRAWQEAQHPHPCSIGSYSMHCLQILCFLEGLRVSRNYILILFFPLVLG